MILENMNALEKMAQMKSISAILEARVDSFVGRNSKTIYKRHKSSDYIKMSQEFSLGGHGKWDVRMSFLKIDNRGFLTMWTAYQKYFVKYAKDPSNIGAGFYVISKSHSLSSFSESYRYIEITPHCVNRTKERYPDMKDESLDVIKMKIVSELGASNKEYDESKTCSKESCLYDMTIFSEEGQFFGSMTKDGKFMCLTTFVSNELLKREQHAYALAMKMCTNPTESYSREELQEEAGRMVKRMAKAGMDVSRLDELKKEVLHEQMLDNVRTSIARSASRKRINRILGCML